MIRTCKTCGKEFKSYYYGRANLYCSRECAAVGRRKLDRINCTCDFCGKEFVRKKDRAYDNHKNHFCCIECANLFQKKNKIKLVCKTCGKTFYRSKGWQKTRAGFYCSISCRTKDEEWRLKAIHCGNQVQNKKKGANRLEKAGNAILEELGVDFETQFLVNGKICVDVFIPSNKIVIQWDGSYWHGKDKPLDQLELRIRRRVNLDKSQDQYLKTCGYIVLRFWDTDVYERKEYVCDIIKRAIRETSQQI